MNLRPTLQPLTHLIDNMDYLNAREYFFNAFMTGVDLPRARENYLNTIWDHYKVPEEARGK